MRREEAADIIEGALALNIRRIKKITLSLPLDKAKSPERVSLRPALVGNERVFMLEHLTADNKAITKRISTDRLPSLVASLAVGEYRQTNVLAVEGELTVMCSKSGSVTVNNRIKQSGELEAPEHDRKKNYLIDSYADTPFLSALGVCDKDGNVYDKKRAKYRQINRFTELLDDVYDKLPSDPCHTLTVCDLCCGKSYLTFAVYYYLVKIRKRSVRMFGVDLKADVINLCESLARTLDCGGLTFVCGDITSFDPGCAPDLVISLHACDTATDAVLAYAVKNNAGMILSTPCCHHELFHKMNAPSLSFIGRHSILKQKLADAATDAMRALVLESKGYGVEAIELIDPEETPKNVMLRAVRTNKINPAGKARAEKQLAEATALLGAAPALVGLLEDDKRV